MCLLVRRTVGARRGRLLTARAHARHPASSTHALPVAALPRGATPPIRAARGREGSGVCPSALRADGRGASLSPPPAARQRGWGRWRAPRGARRRGHVPARAPNGRCATWPASHRQSPCASPGRQHTCPPRRRAAARRHPSHPRCARTGGERGCSIRAWRGLDGCNQRVGRSAIAWLSRATRSCRGRAGRWDAGSGARARARAPASSGRARRPRGCGRRRSPRRRPRGNARAT